MKTILLLVATLASLSAVEFRMFLLNEVAEKTANTIYSENFKHFERSEDSTLSEKDIASVEITRQFDENALLITFNEIGARKNKAFTEKNLHKQIALMIDGKVISAPIVMHPSEDQTVISGNFTENELKDMLASLRSVIPVPVIVP